MTLLMFNNNTWRNSFPFRDINIWNSSDLKLDLSRSLKPIYTSSRFRRISKLPKPQMHRITFEWLYKQTPDGQRYPAHISYLPSGPRFLSLSFYDQPFSRLFCLKSQMHRITQQYLAVMRSLCVLNYYSLPPNCCLFGSTTNSSWDKDAEIANARNDPSMTLNKHFVYTKYLP